MRLTYPSRTFGLEAKKALDASASLLVFIPNGWRVRLIEKSVSVWPCSERVDADFAKRAGWSWIISNLLFPTLLVIHWAFIRAGYQMQYSLDSKGLSMDYRRVC
jgi:hypothetical protein